jgi:hypothetical protein
MGRGRADARRDLAAQTGEGKRDRTATIDSPFLAGHSLDRSLSGSYPVMVDIHDRNPDPATLKSK